MTLIQGTIELLPDRETFDKTPCPKCFELLGTHMNGDQWEESCGVTVDDLVDAGLAK